MDQKEILKFYEELQEWYGDALANFEHYPRIFASQVKHYRYHKERQNANNSSESINS